MGVPFKAKNGLDANSNKIVNVSNPTAAQDAATKLYVDNAVGTGLPSQTGNSGKFLTTDATTASWSLVPVAGINATGTPSITTYLRGDGTWATVAAGGVTAVTGTSPVASSGGTTPAISLNSGYGDTQNPYASKTANYVLAAPNGSAGVPTFRAIVAADIPTLNQNTTGSAGSVPASGLTGSTLASNVTASSLTSVGTLTGLTVTTNPSYFRKNQTDGSYTTAAIWTESYGTTTTGIAFHISGVAGKFLEMRTNGTLYFDNFVMLNSGNYNSYAPTLTGTGASGSWGISITGSAGSVTGLTINNSSSVIDPNSVTQNQIGYANSVSLFGQTDGGLYSSAYNSSWIHEIFGDFRTGQIAIRGKNSGTFTAWRTVLDSTNYTSYSPTLTGTGASGSWGISITGSAGSISSFNNPTTAPTANTIVYRDSIGDIAAREIILSSGLSAVTPTVLVSMYPSTNQLVRTTPSAVAAALSGQTMNITGNATGSSGSCTGNSATATQLSFSGNTRYMAANQWAGAGGYDGYTFVGGNSRFGFSSTGGYVDVYADGNFYAGIDLNGLNNLVLHAGNYSSYAIARGGDTVDGVILFRSNKGNNVYLANTNTMQLQAYSSDGGTAAMSFHRAGQYAVNFGLDPDNVLRLGGWSAPANVMQVNMSGDLTMLRYIFATDFNQSGGNSSNPTIGQIWTQNTSDNYCRKSTPAHFKTQLNLYSGAAGSGVITISQSAPSGGATNDIWLQW